MIRTCFALVFAALCVAPVLGEGPVDSLKSGDVALQSAGALAFGPDGILFVGDSTAGAIVALDTSDRTKADKKPDLKLEKLDGKIASLLGVETAQLSVNNMAVNPISGNLYLSVTRGKGADAKPVLLKLDGSGKLSEVSLKAVKSATAMLPNATKNQKQRQDVITNMAYVKGTVYVAGLSNEEFASTLRAIPFPFSEVNKGTGVGIFHGAHGKFETASPVRTFVPYDIAGETNLLAAYTCTPLVKFPISQLKPGEKVKGTTVAELGNMNRPLDMIVYTKGGEDFILMANSARGIMKIPTKGMDKADAITEPVKGGGPAGHKYEKIEALKNVVHLSKIDDARGVVLIRTGGGDLNVETIALP
jgi:hypothetical protein